jgi:hypothetical protein
VSRISSGLIWLVALCVTLPAASAHAGGMEMLMPGNTKGFYAVTNYDDWQAHWDKTDVGKMLNDPIMAPFRKDLRGQLQQRWAEFRRKLGMSLDDLNGVPGGEMATAVIAISPQKTGNLILIDITNHFPQARELVKKITANQRAAGATQSQATMMGVPILVFKIPKETDNAHYFVTGNLFGAADDPGVVQFVLAHAAAASSGTLADLPAFRYVMARCKQDAGNVTPQVRWFIEPVAYNKATRLDNPNYKQKRKGKSWLDIAESQGFEGIKGTGGFVDVDADTFQILHRTAVYAPKPWDKSMKILVFPNGTEFTPQPWVPRDVATYANFYDDVLNSIDHFGPLFDEMYGEGDKGTWDDVLKGMKEDPKGPRVDLRNDLVAQLTNRVTVLTDYVLPMGPTSERTITALECKNEKAVAAAMGRLMNNDKTYRRLSFKGQTIWESIPPKKKTTKEVRIAAPKLNNDDEEEEQQQQKFYSTSAISVAMGQMFMASHRDILETVLTPRPAAESLAQDFQYKVIAQMHKQFQPQPMFLQFFSHTDEEYWANYELLRLGQMPQGETLMARMLNNWYGTPDQPVRKQQISGKQMPSYDFVRRSLAPSGIYGVTEENGWFFKGYMLRKSK